jgi:DinB family.
MKDLTEVIAIDLAEYYQMVRDQTHHWVDSLNEEQFWQRPFEHGNSVGHLLLHMTGNL